MNTHPNDREKVGAGPGVRTPVVLIVDDMPDNLLACEAMLRRDDIEIITAASGRAALELLHEREVALAIIEVQMPEMDGFELASLMRGVERTRHVPIVFVTAASQDESRVFKGYECGAVDYLFKPVNERILRSKVNVFITLERHRQQLRETDRMRERFIAVLGHDLRDPLNGMLTNALLIERRSTDACMRESAGRIRLQGQRMKRLIDQLLDTTRCRQDGGVSLSPAAVDLRRLTQQILGEVADVGRTIDVEAAGDTTGTWDADRVLQVLSNLVGNAVKHSPPGSPVVVTIDGRDCALVELTVHNSGPPIPEALHSTLFEPFRRSEHRSSSEEGLGLGLYISQQFVQAHGGTLTFSSDERSGTRFVTRLPRHVHPPRRPSRR